MKATGIVRRIDDLGRVVIPKEVRRFLKIKEGDPLEIYTDDGAVCFKPYNPHEDELTTVIKAMFEHLSYHIGVYNRYGYLIVSSWDKAPSSWEGVQSMYGCWNLNKDGECVCRIVALEELNEEVEHLVEYLYSVLENMLEGI